MSKTIKFDNYTVKIKRDRDTGDNYNVSVRVFKDNSVIGFFLKEGTTDKEILKDVFFAIDKKQI